MDGVLCDFDGAFEQLTGKHIRQFVMTSEHSDDYWRVIDRQEHFWDTLPRIMTHEDWLRLNVLADQYDQTICILSKPTTYKSNYTKCIDGKNVWLDRELGNKVPRIYAYDKSKYAYTPDGKRNVLIDDYGVNIKAWDEAGGLSVKFEGGFDESFWEHVEKQLQSVSST